MTEFDALTTAQCDAQESVLELSLLLSRQQMNKLAVVAKRQGLTSAQFLRKMISAVCESEALSS